MFEVHVRGPHGWQPLNCQCPAGRAVFASEEQAKSAILNHLFDCAGGSADDGSSGGAFRLFAVDLASAA
jgi:hypothetical protein